MRKLILGLVFCFGFCLLLSSGSWGVKYATDPPNDWKIYNVVLTTAETVYTVVLTTDAYSVVTNAYGTPESVLTTSGGAVVSYDLIARLGDIKWLETSSSTAEYRTIKQDVCVYPNLPVLIAKNTLWYFKSSTANATIEAQVWHY